MEKHLPFEKIFGNTAELRLIEFLLSLKDISFTVQELSEMTEADANKLQHRIIPKLLTFEIVKAIEMPSGNFQYIINSDSVVVKSLYAIDNDIIEHLLTDEENAEIYEALHGNNGQQIS